jgi:hypothetical protein
MKFRDLEYNTQVNIVLLTSIIIFTLFITSVYVQLPGKRSYFIFLFDILYIGIIFFRYKYKR